MNVEGRSVRGTLENHGDEVFRARFGKDETFIGRRSVGVDDISRPICISIAFELRRDIESMY